MATGKIFRIVRYSVTNATKSVINALDLIKMNVLLATKIII